MSLSIRSLVVLLALFVVPKSADAFCILPRLSHTTTASSDRLLSPIRILRGVCLTPISSRRDRTIVLDSPPSASLSPTTNFTSEHFAIHEVSDALTVDDANGNILDVPLPTLNGGYTHTTASKAKISAANKGRTPWNKGRKRSPEERARIAAGVRARNRERFLEKLASLNMTETEWDQQEAEKKRIKAERIAKRRTEKGGYRPTEETRKKISQILKEKHARGEVKRSPTDPTKVRRGFQHSEETRRKISESLRKRWATDEEYRENMREKSRTTNKSIETRQRISVSLRQKWQDPEFRSHMMSKIESRSSPGAHNESHRERISEAMKLKWQDGDYRRKTLEAIARKRKEQSSQRENDPSRRKTTRASSRDAVKKVMPAKVAAGGAKVSDGTASAVSPKNVVTQPASKVREERSELTPIQPLQTGATRKKSVKKKRVLEKKKKQKKSTNEVAPVSANDKLPALKGKERTNGSVSRLREERRDLYDLLYGDEDESSHRSVNGGNHFTSLLGDENLDTFDPYGLDDF